MAKKQKVTLSLLLMNLFIAFLGISLVIAVLPSLMNELSISGTVVGYLTAAFALTQLVVSPFAGAIILCVPAFLNRFVRPIFLDAQVLDIHLKYRAP